MIGYAKAGSIAIAQTDERSILRNPEHRKPQCLSSDSVMKAFKLTAAFAKTTAIIKTTFPIVIALLRCWTWLQVL
jgi:hypothetical protein